MEVAIGKAALDGRRVRVVDLPGTYSLFAGSPEEQLAREYILAGEADLVLVVLNALNLEQELPFLAEVLAHPVPVMVVLTMLDMTRRRGYTVDTSFLEERLGVPVAALDRRRPGSYSRVLRRAAAVAEEASARTAWRPPSGPLAGLAGSAESGWDPVAAFARVRPWADALLERALVPVQGERGRPGASCPVRKEDLEPADRWLTHPVCGLVFLLGVLGATFWLTFNIGIPVQAWMERALVVPAAAWLGRVTAGAPAWVGAVLVDGLLAGAGTVATFAPLLAVFFTLMALLEDSGYMARAAVVTDRFMHRLRLHGKSFLPLFMGFGCSVPAILGARTIEWGWGRLLTVLLAPVVPCAGRLAVLTYIGGVFFGRGATVVVWSIVGLALLFLVGLGVVLSRLSGHRGQYELVMELPAYRLPDPRATWRLVSRRVGEFLVRAGTLIIAASALVWAAGYLPGGDLETSYIAHFGRWLEPLGLWAGLDWRLVVAVLTGLVAKENSVAALGVLYAGFGGESLTETLRATVSPASAVAFMAVVALFVPCVAALATLWRETAGQRLWLAVVVAGMAVSSWAAGFVVYRLALFAGL